MKKILWVLPIIMFFVFLLPVNAQMMGGSPDEAAGKAVWDKLQNKQVTCKDLKDDDFDVLGDFFMGNMMGSNHASMNQMMVQRLGENGEKQMHITMGKRLSGCDSSASFPQGSSYFMPMMGFGGMMGGNWNQSWGGGGSGMMEFGNWNNMMGNTWGVFGVLTWLLIIIFLILGIIHLWKGVNKPGR